MHIHSSHTLADSTDRLGPTPTRVRARTGRRRFDFFAVESQSTPAAVDYQPQQELGKIRELGTKDSQAYRKR